MKKHEYIVILIIITLGFTFHFKYINAFPSHIHAWTQADRFALALGFVDNGLNFFKPQTFVMNHQFPGNWQVPSNESITAVDFPIHDYIPAIFMKLFGIKSPWIFRSYIVLYSFIGLFFLFRLSYLLTDDMYKSVFIFLFAATSPVFVYYQSGFIPSVPSLANAIIGVYFYFKHLRQNDKRSFNLCLLFLTLAALSRTTFAIPLIAVFAMELLRVLKKEVKLGTKLIPVVFAILSLLLYAIYNHYLGERYGSIFLSHLLPASSFAEARELLKLTYQNWHTQYFSAIHYCYLIFAAIIVLLIFFRNKISVVNYSIPLLLLFTIMFVGCFIFMVLMIKQFPAHDYYFLDTFFLPVILFLIFLLSALPKITLRYSKTVYSLLLLFLGMPLILNAVKTQKARRKTSYSDRTTITTNNFKDSESFLDSLQIGKDAKILVIDAYAPNIPFILMHRKGYVVMTTSKDNIQRALTWNYDFIVTQNNLFSDIDDSYPDILRRINKIADNGKLSVYKLMEQ